MFYVQTGPVHMSLIVNGYLSDRNLSDGGRLNGLQLGGSHYDRVICIYCKEVKEAKTDEEREKYLKELDAILENGI